MDKKGEKNINFIHREENDSTYTYTQTNSNGNHLLIINNKTYQNNFFVNLLYNIILFQRN